MRYLGRYLVDKRRMNGEVDHRTTPHSNLVYPEFNIVPCFTSEDYIETKNGTEQLKI